jgi:hypothetical protein
MTEQREKIFSEAARFPEAEQDTVAALIREELDSERRWQAAFHASADTLAVLANEALAEYRAGETQPLDPEPA